MKNRPNNAETRIAPHAERRGAFTLIELLTVISIIAVIASLSLPVLRKRPNAINSANSILMADLALARQRAIAYRTMVYVVFMPPVTLNRASVFANVPEKDVEYVINGQHTKYALFARRTVGEQPGVDRPRYLTPWRALPEGVFIPATKFLTNRNDAVRFSTALEPNRILEVPPFEYTNSIPVPRSTNVFSTNPDGSGRIVYPNMPYIAFDDQGRLTSGIDAIIPLSRGFATPSREGGKLSWKPAKIREIPIGNTISNYNHIRIDWLTGRARVEQMQIR